MNRTVNYRPDIDGLRAIAILLVVGFHFFPEKIASGFIGVDIFFVISGYLITSIIVNEAKLQKFNLKSFYVKRIRRIFPALIVVLLATLASGYFFLLPDEYQQLGNHTFASSFFIQNFALLKEVGYFDNAAESKPLLHLWSLSIEEQFYILWPVVLLIAIKLKLRLQYLAFFLIGISFFLNLREINVHHNPINSFFLPQTRFWEILAGALLAIQEFNLTYSQKEQKFQFENIKSTLGFIILAIGLLIITKQNYPGYQALIPVIGACLIISSRPQSIPNSYLLNNRILISIGLISFPLYLWHWSILSITQVVHTEHLSLLIKLLLITISFALAWATYQFIEIPLRKINASAKLIIAILATALIGFLIARYDGIPQRSINTPLTPIKNINDRGLIGHHNFMVHLNNNFYPCTPEKILKSSELFNKNIPTCFQSKKSSNKDIALIGDSHAESMFLGLATIFQDKNWVYYIKGNAPVLKNSLFKEIFNEITQDQNIKTVVIIANWMTKITQVPNGSSFEDQLSATVKYFIDNNKEVILVTDVPNFTRDMTTCFLVRKSKKNDFSCIEKNSTFKIHHQKLLKVFNQIKLNNNKVKIIDTFKLFCQDESCQTIQDEQLLFRDNNHLNIAGSIYIAKNIYSTNRVLIHD